MVRFAGPGNLGNAPKVPPASADMTAIRRSLRVGPHAGALLEDYGVTRDQAHRMTRKDVLCSNDDLIERAASVLNGMFMPADSNPVSGLTYYIDLLNWLLEGNGVVEVVARGQRGVIQESGYGAPDVVGVLLTYADGAISNLGVSYALPPKYPALGHAARVEILGTDGVMLLDDDHTDQLMFLPGSDLSTLEVKKREFYNGLTKWKSDVERGTGESKMIAVEGATYEDALIKANNLMITNLWGDGLPVWPATRERVDWILRGTSLPRTHAFGKFPPRGGVTTVETCAIALAMAGGRPEYLPVLIATVEAVLDPDSNFDQLQATSGAPFPVVIVNGPIAKQIRLNSGFGCLGPDPQQPAGGSIGRALRMTWFAVVSP